MELGLYIDIDGEPPRVMVEDARTHKDVGEFKGHIVCDGVVRPLSFEELHRLLHESHESEIVRNAGCQGGKFGEDLAKAVLGLGRKHRISPDGAMMFAEDIILRSFMEREKAAGR